MGAGSSAGQSGSWWSVGEVGEERLVSSGAAPQIARSSRAGGKAFDKSIVGIASSNGNTNILATAVGKVRNDQRLARRSPAFLRCHRAAALPQSPAPIALNNMLHVAQHRSPRLRPRARCGAASDLRLSPGCGPADDDVAAADAPVPRSTRPPPSSPSPRPSTADRTRLGRRALAPTGWPRRRPVRPRPVHRLCPH